MLPRFFILLMLASPVWAAERIVSINQCADELLLNIVPHKYLKSVTHFVKDPAVSWDAELAAAIPGNSGRAEEVMAYAPDLVFAGDFSARSTVSMLRNLGIEVVELAHPRSLDEVIDLIRQVGEATGSRTSADALARGLRKPVASGERVVTAAVYQPNGFTTGRDSLVDDVLRVAGVRNVASERGLSSYARYPMELLLLDQPELLILDPQSQGGPSLAHQLLQHPALDEVYSTSSRIEIPPQAWACGTHHVFAAVEMIRSAARGRRL